MTCTIFEPDHNGECLNCDEWMPAHSAEAIDAGFQAAIARGLADVAAGRTRPLADVNADIRAAIEHGWQQAQAGELVDGFDAMRRIRERLLARRGSAPATDETSQEPSE